MAKELKALRKELEESREAALAGYGREAELERQHREKLEREHQKRVEHLVQLGIRRMMQASLARGWTAWHDQYNEQIRKKNMLKSAGMRLRKPKLVASFKHWQDDWEAELAMKEKMTQQERLAHEAAKRATLQADLTAEVEQLRQELEQARADMLSGRGAEAEKQRLLKLKLEEEKEKRVKHLQQIGVKRMMQAGLARGWSGWHEMWTEQVRKKNMLRAAAGRLRKPKLVACFMHWQREFDLDVAAKEAERAADEAKGIEMRLHEERTLRKVVQSELEQVRLELTVAREAMASGRGKELELQRQMEEQKRKEKEERIEQLRKSAVRRIKNKDLGRGWSAWLEEYLDQQRNKRLLKGAANRLTKPKLVKAWAHWHHDWATEKDITANMSQEQLFQRELKAVREREALLEDELTMIKLQLIAAKEDKVEGTGKEAELNRLHEDELEAEREKRVQHLQQLGVRRLMQQGLARGWTKWLDEFRDWQRKNRLLRNAGNRLARPKFVASFAHWKSDWEATFALLAADERRRKDAGAEERFQAEVAKRAKVEEELLTVKLELVAARESFSAAQGKDVDKSRDYEAALEAEREKRVAHLQQIGIRRLMHAGLARGWSSWLAEHLERQRKRQMIQDALNRLKFPKLIAGWKHWQKSWTDAMEKAASKMNEKRSAEDLEKMAALEAEMRRVRAQCDQELTLQKVALAEARESAYNALQSASSNHAIAESARRDAKEAMDSSRLASQAATQAQTLLKQQQDTAAKQLATLLAEQRHSMTTELVNSREKYEDIIADLKRKLAEALERIKAPPKPSPPPAPAPAPAPARPSSAKFGKSKFHLKNPDTCGQTIVEQLREQLKAKSLRTLDLFRELDEDEDGSISKKDWTKGMKKISEEDVTKEQLDAAFDAADPDNSNSVEYTELDAFIKGRAPVGTKGPEVKKRRQSVARVKPSLLAALATSMGIRPPVVSAESADQAGSGEADFESMMKARAEQFGAADLNFDGKLDFNEFCIMTRAREVTEYTDEQLREKFTQLDTDGSGSIDQNEFISFSLKDALKRSKGRAIDIFRIWDDDNSGMIDKNEFAKAVVALGFCCSRQDIDRVFNSLDEDGSGSIEYGELNAMLRKGAGSAGSKVEVSLAPPKKGGKTPGKPATRAATKK